MRTHSNRAKAFETRRIDRPDLGETQQSPPVEPQGDYAARESNAGATRPNRYLNFAQPTTELRPAVVQPAQPDSLPEVPRRVRPQMRGPVARGNTGSTTAIFKLFAQSEQHVKLAITAEHGLFVLLVGLTFLVRVANLTFGSLHLDEAIYSTVGQQALAGVFDQGATRWMFGSYLYPMLAGLANQFGGVAGLRLLSAVLITVASVFVYFATRRVFGDQAALWALFLFGLSGISINLGQHAAIDALGVPLLAASLYCMVSAIKVPRRERFYFLLAGITFSLSVLAKYIGALMLPALITIMLMLYLYERRSLSAFFSKVAWSYFFIPVVVILGLYGLSHYSDLREVLSGRFATQYAEGGPLAQFAVQEIGPVSVLAIGGLAVVVARSVDRLYQTNRVRLALFLLGLAPLLLSILAMPLYHVFSANFRSMWKHNVYALIFLAPLAGYLVAQIVAWVRSIHGRHALPLRFLGAALTVVAMFWYANAARAENDDFHHSWPYLQPVMQFMESQHITDKSRVLASAYAVYEYYFNLGPHAHHVWDNVWYAEYRGLIGLDGVKAAIRDCAYNLAVLDEYYAPDLNPVLEPLLKQAGYTLGYEEPSRGPHVGIRAYVRPARCKT
jgi:4-amino-4-deoxy-L-arabinose transferase-like glycosyltransferase